VNRIDGMWTRSPVNRGDGQSFGFLPPLPMSLSKMASEMPLLMISTMMTRLPYVAGETMYGTPAFWRTVSFIKSLKLRS